MVKSVHSKQFSVWGHMVKIFVFLILSLGQLAVFGMDESKAVSESSQNKGIKLLLKAQKNIGIRTEKLSFKDYFIIPKSSLVYTKDKTGVYCLRDGWFKFVEVNLISKNENSLSVSSKELNINETIVIEGAALLRVSEMEAFSSEE